jgi:hypothetical protein
MLDDAVENARHIQAVTYSNGKWFACHLQGSGDANVSSRLVAAFAFLVWELCITFPDEIGFIWS